MSIFLSSGIPLNTKSSFYWQLTLLKQGFKRKGIDTLLISPIPNNGLERDNNFSDGIIFVDYKNDKILKLIKEHKPEALILLGYPDEFPFLFKSMKLPVAYLWSQFSKPPVLNEYSRKRLIFVPLTEKTREYCIRAGVENILEPIPHGIPPDIYHPFDDVTKRNLRDSMGLKNKFVIGTVAKNIIRKRLNDVVKVFSMVLSSIDDSVLIIKTDKEVSKDGYNLPILLNSYDFSERVIILKGDYSHNKMTDLYNCMDVYIQLSEWEGFGIPVVEAMACGIPVVTHDVQGPGEIVNVAGIVVSSREYIDDSGAFLSYANVKEAADAIIRIYEARGLRKSLSKKAVEIVRDKYDMNIIVDKWIEVMSF